MQESIEGLRKRIDSLDKALIETLSRRMELVERVAVLKREQGLALKQPEREKEMLAARKDLALALRVSPKLVESVFRQIIAYSLKRQAKGNCYNRGL